MLKGKVKYALLAVAASWRGARAQRPIAGDPVSLSRDGALAPLHADADGPPAKGGLRVFEGAPGDKNFLDASSRDAARKSRASRDASVDTRRARPNSSPTTPRRASPAQ